MFRRSQPSAERPSFPCPPSGFQGVVPGPSGPRPAPAAPLSPGALSWAGLGVRLSPFGLCKGVSPPRVRGHAYSLRAAKADPRPCSDVSTNPAGCGRVQALLCGCRCGRLRGPFRTPCPFSRAPPASSGRAHLGPAMGRACVGGIEGGASALRGHFRPRAPGFKIKAEGAWRGRQEGVGWSPREPVTLLSTLGEN